MMDHDTGKGRAAHCTPGFVPRAEREDVNVSPTHPLKELAVLVGGITGAAVLLFLAAALAIDLATPLVPPKIELRVFGGWADQVVRGVSDDERERVDHAQAVLDRLVAHWPECPYPVRVGITRSDDVNAFAIPGGAILVTTGLLDAVEDEQALAFVLGHELGHFANRDHLRSMGRGTVLGLLVAVLAGGGAPRPVVDLVTHVDEAASRGMDRRQEEAADRFGHQLVVAEYGSASGALGFLERLEDEQASETDPWLAYMNTHPAATERLETARARAADETR